MQTKLRVVDFCAGLGGAVLGFKLAGFEVLLALERDHDLRQLLSTNTNVPTSGYDIKIVDIPHPDVGCGCIYDRSLLPEVFRLVKGINPRFLLFESQKGGVTKEDWKEIGYIADVEKLLASDYGSPQNKLIEIHLCRRADVIVNYYAFPFPDSKGRCKLQDFLGPGLIAKADQLPSIGLRVDKHPHLYHIQDAETKIERPLTIEELKTYVGAGGLTIPGNKENVLKELGRFSCPTVIQAVVTELKDWM